jgi:hypothetical protein
VVEVPPEERAYLASSTARPFDERSPYRSKLRVERRSTLGRPTSNIGIGRVSPPLDAGSAGRAAI